MQPLQRLSRVRPPAWLEWTLITVAIWVSSLAAVACVAWLVSGEQSGVREGLKWAAMVSFAVVVIVAMVWARMNFQVRMGSTFALIAATVTVLGGPAVEALMPLSDVLASCVADKNLSESCYADGTNAREWVNLAVYLAGAAFAVVSVEVGRREVRSEAGGSEEKRSKASG